MAVQVDVVCSGAENPVLLLQDPSLRITAAEFLLRVSNLMESDVPDIMDEVHRKHAEALTGCMGQCGCSIM